MSVGQANGILFSQRDLEGIAASFDALSLSGRVPIKFGHNDEQALTDGQPALGWISKVYMAGEKLLGDFIDMPTQVYDLLRSGAYKFLSVELLKNVTAGTRVLPWVLDAVALLGADQPAFGNLKDLQSLTLKRKPVLQARARVAFRRAATKFSTGANKAMDEKEVQAVVAAAVEKATSELTVKFTKQLTDEVKKAKDEAKVEADAQLAKQKAEAHRAAVKAKFESAVKAEIILPAEREQFYRFNRVDDDTVVTTIKLEDVDAYIEKFGDKAKLAASRRTTTQTETGDPAEAKLSAAERVHYRARKLCFERKQDPNKFEFINDATIEVLKADKALGESYKRLEDAPAAA